MGVKLTGTLFFLLGTLFIGISIAYFYSWETYQNCSQSGYMLAAAISFTIIYWSIGLLSALEIDFRELSEQKRELFSWIFLVLAVLSMISNTFSVAMFLNDFECYRDNLFGLIIFIFGILNFLVLLIYPLKEFYSSTKGFLIVFFPDHISSPTFEEVGEEI